MQPLSLASPSSPSLSTVSSPSLSSQANPLSALHHAQSRARRCEEQLTALEAAVNAAIASCLSSSSAASRETRRERKAVARLLMPVVLRTEMYRRWKQRVKAGRPGSIGAEEDGQRAGGDRKQREGVLPVEDEELLMREVMQEDAEMRQWREEDKHALIRFLLFKARESEMRQRETAAPGGAAAAAAAASGSAASDEDRMTLDELMEASMILYHALMDSNHKLAQLQANTFPPLLPSTTPVPPSSASFASSSSSMSPLPPSASAVSSSALSLSAAAGSAPVAGRDAAFYLQQHELDVEENRRLRAALSQYQQLLASPSCPRTSLLPPLSSLLASSMTSMASLLSLLQLLYMSACLLSWSWQRARREAAGELDRRRPARGGGESAGLQEDRGHSVGSGGWWSSWLGWLLSFLP